MQKKIYPIIIITGILVDQITKHLAQTFLSFFKPFVIAKNILSLHLVHNYGAAYGILQNKRILLLSISLLVLFIIFFNFKKIATTSLAKFALCFLLIGIIGNFIDRLLFGYVIDFININIVPVFNFADVFIDIGIIGLAWDIFTNNEKAKTKSK